jgi:hypothetical protein
MGGCCCGFGCKCARLNNHSKEGGARPRIDYTDQSADMLLPHLRRSTVRAGGLTPLSRTPSRSRSTG